MLVLSLLMQQCSGIAHACIVVLEADAAAGRVVAAAAVAVAEEEEILKPKVCDAAVLSFLVFG
jgi:hypothetical protein